VSAGPINDRYDYLLSIMNVLSQVTGEAENVPDRGALLSRCDQTAAALGNRGKIPEIEAFSVVL
jgi:hypothetical protein